MLGFSSVKNRKDFYYPLEMKIYREKLIEEKIAYEGSFSYIDYDYLLRGISVDVYEGIDGLKYWHSFSIKGSLLAYSSLGIFIPRYNNFRNLIKKGFESEDLALDNYKRVLTGLEIANDTRSINDVKVLIKQLYNAERYTSNYSYYMGDLKRIMLTKNFDSPYNETFVEEMKKRREKVLSLDKKYSPNKK